jgi:hypothetical protein
MLLLAVLLLTGGVLAFVLAPLALGQRAPLTDGPDLVAELRELYALRDTTYETLRDLEFDFSAGKMGERDYRDLSERFKLEAMQVVQKIDAVEARLPARSRRGSEPRRRGPR